MSATRPIRVLALVPYALDTAPSQRFRLEQWKPHLQRLGIEMHIVPFADADLMAQLYRNDRRLASAWKLTVAWWRRFARVVSARDYDAVVVHRAAAIVGPAWHERILAMRSAPVIYDFDDAIFLLHTTAGNRSFGWLKFPGKTEMICRLSQHVVAGNGYLRKFALQFNDRVTVIPTSIDTEAYRERGPATSERVAVGWAGSATSQDHLEAFAPILLEAAARWNFDLSVLSDKPPRLDGLAYKWIPWSRDVGAEVDALSGFDIGIMPMPDDEWSRGKCGLKALQYMAVGAATVCSPVGFNRDLIRHGENGMLASSPEEWVACLGVLISDRCLRERLGRAGRKTVEQGYSARLSAERFAGVVRDLVCP
jgi:glycosyltransferase involved in cell wall biosynthesis